MKTTTTCVRALLMGMSVLLIACSGKTVVESDLRIKGAPDWVNEGTNVLEDRGGRLFHGVGSAPPLGDMSLQTSTADDRARAEVARIFSSYMRVLSEDFLASAGSGEQRVSEQTVSRDIRSLTEVNLSGARIIGRWRHRDGTIYALAELDLDQVKRTLSKVQDMNGGFRHFADKNAENVFDRMVREAGQ